MKIAPFHPLQESFDWDALLKRLMSNGGLFADVYWEKSLQHRYHAESGRVKNLMAGMDEGLAFRLVTEDGSFLATTNSMDPADWQRCVTDLLQMSRGATVKNVTLADGQGRGAPSIVTDLSKQSLRMRCDTASDIWRKLSSIPKLKSCGIRALDETKEIFLVRSSGTRLTDTRPIFRMWIDCLSDAPSGPVDAFETLGGRMDWSWLNKDRIEEIRTKLERRLGNLSRAVPAPAGSLPVVLSATAGGTMIHEAVGHGLEADLVSKGFSIYKDRIGTQVASPQVTVVDDGTLATHLGSLGFDDEGTATSRTVLIEKGILKGYMTDMSSSIKLGLPLTGNARRQSYRFPPLCRMTNTYVSSGQDNVQGILGSTPYGLYVVQMGGGQVDTTTGDFSFAVTESYLIRNGEIGEAVRGATLVGNGPRVMQEIDRVGTDLGWATGTCGKDNQAVPVTDALPTIRIPKITVGGLVPSSTYFGDV